MGVPPVIIQRLDWDFPSFQPSSKLGYPNDYGNRHIGGWSSIHFHMGKKYRHDLWMSGFSRMD